MNLGVILDAMEDKRTPLDFESLKEDLRKLGAGLRVGFEEARAGFEEARQNIKRTQRFAASSPTVPEAESTPEARIKARRKKRRKEEELSCSVGAPAQPEIKIKEKYRPRSRQYSLQQAMLSIFGGGAGSLVLYNLLNTAGSSGLLASLERTLIEHNPQLSGITGLAPVFQLLWLLGLIPVAKGVAHLINGIFFAPKPTSAASEPIAPQPIYTPEPPSLATPSTNEFEPDLKAGFRPSITEDPTAQFVPREADQVKSSS
jgi:hypothetical protein